MNEFEDIAIKAWASNPLTDPALVEVRDNVRRSVGIALRINTGRGDGKVIAASWMGTALALVDSLDLEDLRNYVNVLPPAFSRALESATTAGRIADHHGRDRDWLARQDLTHASLYFEAVQYDVNKWVIECLGEDSANDVRERNHRFLEEALELIQANGCSRSEAHQLVDYVFDRDVGEVNQEAGGLLVTLAALANQAKIHLGEAARKEIKRIWQNIPKIRAKQAAKPSHLPDGGEQ